MSQKTSIEMVLWLALPFVGACVWIELAVDQTAVRLVLGAVALLGLLPASVLLRHRRRLLGSRVAERELRVSERRYRRLFENVIEGIYQSTPNGRIISANPALAKMLGYDSVDELRNVDIAAGIYSDSDERDYLLRKMDQDGELRNIEIILKRKTARSSLCSRTAGG
ncbi:MAG: PAS domain S-box protein [Bryobacteraceae bacterium]